MLEHTYLKSDVSVLLHPVEPQFLTVDEKEKLIQSGTHYSQILSKEMPPAAQYLTLFDHKVGQFADELGQDLLALAGMIISKRARPVLVSFARAGTPIGVIVHRILKAAGIEAPHFSVSIVRNRGLDMRAIEHILALGHAPEDIVFIDGWTGKGVIRRTLSESLACADERFQNIADELFVVGDIAGVAEFAATRRDTLIPSCLLNATVSGLFSRSVTRDPKGVEAHGGAFLSDLALFDRSLAFVHAITRAALADGVEHLREKGLKAIQDNQDQQCTADKMASLTRHIMSELKIVDINLIKPGIGESSRVLLRRVPRCLIVQDDLCQTVEHLVMLSKQRGIPVLVWKDIPVKAIAIIKEIGDE